jgi:Asp-tRNA(Asn)/Glu-tRNA(Gln) amidotransferase A subunit family amidase
MGNHHAKKRDMSKIGIFILVFTLAFTIFGGAFALYYFKGLKTLTDKDILSAEKIADLRFTGKERKMMLENLRRNIRSYQQMREIELANDVPPSIQFNPILPGMVIQTEPRPFTFSVDPEIRIPENFDDLAFYPVTALAQLIRSRKISSLELTKMYLDRLKKFGPRLECVITLTEELALEQAKKADEEIAADRYRGPLHGIPWGAKDLLATKGIRTTWGAMPYKDQYIDRDATVVKRLEEAGAVLVAKLTMGTLAMGDVWYGGKTKNPWNLEQGSGGSSAGPAAATSAGLVAFSIGTETLGSIVSPSTRCGVTGLRPSYGRVSRFGAMALSWSMDKIGPICRTVEDCALVFHAIYGPDGNDLTIIDAPFGWDPGSDLSQIRVGYLKKAFERKSRTEENDRASLEALRSLGIELIPFDLPDFPARAISFILSAEAAAAFDDITRSGKDDLLVRQGKGAWPNTFRQARFIPAVEYIQANRLRTLLMQKMAEQMREIDVFVTPTYGGDTLLITNLTGHPTVVLPNGFDDKGNPTSLSFVGQLFEEEKTLRVAKAYQDATSFHLQHPQWNKSSENDTSQDNRKTLLARR